MPSFTADMLDSALDLLVVLEQGIRVGRLLVVDAI